MNNRIRLSILIIAAETFQVATRATVVSAAFRFSGLGNGGRTMKAETIEQRLSVRDVAKKLNYSELTVRLMIKNRELGHVRRGVGRGRVYVLPGQLDAYLDSRTFSARAAA